METRSCRLWKNSQIDEYTSDIQCIGNNKYYKKMWLRNLNVIEINKCKTLEDANEKCDKDSHC